MSGIWSHKDADVVICNRKKFRRSWMWEGNLLYFSDKSSPQRLDISQTHNKGHFFPVGKLEEKNQCTGKLCVGWQSQRKGSGKEAAGTAHSSSWGLSEPLTIHRSLHALAVISGVPWLSQFCPASICQCSSQPSPISIWFTDIQIALTGLLPNSWPFQKWESLFFRTMHYRTFM